MANFIDNLRGQIHVLLGEVVAKIGETRTLERQFSFLARQAIDPGFIFIAVLDWSQFAAGLKFTQSAFHPPRLILFSILRYLVELPTHSAHVRFSLALQGLVLVLLRLQLVRGFVQLPAQVFLAFLRTAELLFQ